jgi:hypothetical protein
MHWIDWSIVLTILAGGIAIWFVIGGTRDLRRLFVKPADDKRDTGDDGTVVRRVESDK